MPEKKPLIVSVELKIAVAFAEHQQFLLDHMGDPIALDSVAAHAQLLDKVSRAVRED